MSSDLPKYPSSLPPPVEVGSFIPIIRLLARDLVNDSDFQELAEHIFGHPEDRVEYFYAHDTTNPTAEEQFNRHGIRAKHIDLYFYRAFDPFDDKDFDRVMPGEAKYEWQRKIAATPMWVRVSLELEPWRRKAMDLEYASQATAEAIANREAVVEIKPNFSGIGLNLNSAVRKLKLWWQKRKLDRKE